MYGIIFFILFSILNAKSISVIDAETKKPIIMSLGMLSLKEISSSYNYVTLFGVIHEAKNDNDNQ